MIGKRLLGGWLVGLLIISIVVGCGSEKKVREGMPALYPEDYSFGTNWIGILGAEDRDLVGAGATHETMLKATFNDYSGVQVFLADREMYSASCFIYISKQSQIGQSKDLQVKSVTVKGLKGGDYVMSANGNNSFLPDRAFTDSQVAFAVDSNDGDGDFPHFEDQINAPAFPKLLHLGDLSSSDLSTAPSLGITADRADPLIVEWEASNADYFEFVLVPQNGTDIGYGKLRCIAYDDGYLEVPPEAILALALDTYTTFRVLIERHNFKLHTIADGETTKAVALIDVSSVLEGIVLK